MTEPYHVTWEIDIDADSPREAAEKALAIQRDPYSTATVFTIAGINGEPNIDIDVEAPLGECPTCGAAYGEMGHFPEPCEPTWT